MPLYMTLLTGIICEDGIVIAADSQQTDGEWKRQVNKITVLEFPNACALIAEAGSAIWSGAAVDRLQRKAEKLKIVDEETISNLVVETVRWANADMRKAFCSTADEDNWREFILRPEQNFEWLIAYYWNEKPYLFRIGLSVAGVNKPSNFHRHFQTAGIGRELAEYLLREYASPNMECEFGATIAIYVTEKVNETSLYCSGHSRLGLLRLSHKNLTDDERIVRSRIFAPEEISELGALIRDVEHETKSERDKILTDRLRERTHKLMEQAFNPKRTPLY